MDILISDDHKIVREGLKEILRNIPELNIIEEANDGRETLNLISEKKFDLVLLDISLPDISGLEVLQSIIASKPSQKILILSMHPEEHYAIRALRTGASGYLTKDTAPEELIEAVTKIVLGGKYISSSLAEKIADKVYDKHSELPHLALSTREFEVMLRIAKGISLKDIGKDLFISEKTVTTYRARIMSKMKMGKNAEITHYCLKNGLVE